MKGLTENIEKIIGRIAQLESIAPYTLCGGTALAIQLGHRLSEDLDFMMWRVSKDVKPEVNWPALETEIQKKVGTIEHREILGFDQVLFIVNGVKISFFVSNNYSPIQNRIPYLGNIFLADIDSILAMKIEVMLRRLKYRDYYDIYAIAKAGYSLTEGIANAVKYSGHTLTTKAAIMMLLSLRIPTDTGFAQMQPIYNETIENMRNYFSAQLSH